MKLFVLIFIFLCGCTKVPPRKKISENSFSSSREASLKIYTMYQGKYPYFLGQLLASSCSEPEISQQWKLKIISIAGDHEVHLKITPNQTQFLVDHLKRTTLRNNAQNGVMPAINTLCSEWNVKQDNSVVMKESGSLTQELQSILEPLSYDCMITSDANGWRCDLHNMHSQTEIKTYLSDLQKKSVSQWKMFPYLFSRKLAVANRLNEMALEPENLIRRNSLCQMIKQSQIEELPFILRSKMWQDSFCSPTTARVKLLNLAAIAAEKAYFELETVSGLVDKNNKIGRLNIKLPLATTQVLDENINYWVKIKPDTTTMENIIFSPEEIAVKDQAIIFSNACWNPFFGTDDQNLHLATYLKLTTNQKECFSSIEPADKSSIETYIEQIITGETAFVATNDFSKILNLPVGEYSYTIYLLPKAMTNWSQELEKTLPQSSGTLSWGKHHPFAIIAKW